MAAAADAEEYWAALSQMPCWEAKLLRDLREKKITTITTLERLDGFLGTRGTAQKKLLMETALELNGGWTQERKQTLLFRYTPGCRRRWELGLRVCSDFPLSNNFGAAYPNPSFHRFGARFTRGCEYDYLVAELKGKAGLERHHRMFISSPNRRNSPQTTWLRPIHACLQRFWPATAPRRP